MKRVFSLLPLVLVLLCANLFAQRETQRASAKAKDDAVKAERDLQRRHEAREARREHARFGWRAGAEEARLAAELARENLENIDLEGIMEEARLSAELAHEIAGNFDWEGIAEHAKLAGELAEEMELHGLPELSGLAELEGLSAELAGIPSLDIPPIPVIPPMPGIPFMDSPPIPVIPPMPGVPAMPVIPPIGPIPPHAALAGHGFSWHDGWHGSSRQYRQYLSEDEEVRLNALRSLFNQDEKLALPEAQRLLQDDNWAIRATVLEMLGEVENQAAVGILRAALQKETDKRVKRAAIRALSQRDEPEAREALREILQK